MLNSKIVKEAHKLTREIKSEYPEVNYQVQFGLCLSYLLKNEGEVKMEDERILALRELAQNEGNYNKVWNETEKLSKEIRGRKFNRAEQLSFEYKSINIVNLAIEILKEEVKTSKITNSVKHNSNNAIEATYEGRDAETGEIILPGELIQYINGLGWVRADNY